MTAFLLTSSPGPPSVCPSRPHPAREQLLLLLLGFPSPLQGPLPPTARPNSILGPSELYSLEK